MTKAKKKHTSKPTQWTAMAEGIAFISAALGEPFVTAQGNGLYWGAFARLDGGVRGYPVGLKSITASTCLVTVSWLAAGPEATVKLYAIIGWARYHGHEVETD